MRTIALADWWPVARGTGVSMRRPSDTAEPSPLPAHVGLWLDRMLGEPLSHKQGQEWTGRLQLYLTAEKALAPGASPAGDPPAVAAYRPRFEAWRRALATPERGLERRSFAVEALSRILLHPASSSTVTEGSVLLHHTYSVPYLPGSALKGALRSRLDRLAAGESPEARRLRDLTSEILGCLRNEVPQTSGDPTGVPAAEPEPRGLASLIDFYDALWIPEPPEQAASWWSPLALDIVNPHHPAYYTQGENGRSLPSDTDEPKPVHRLSLAPGTRFLVVAEAPASPQLVPWLDWLLDEVLTTAFAEDGIGAWTSTGYGRLKRLQESRPSPAGALSEPEAVPTAPAWHPALLTYTPGNGELTATITDRRPATASRAKTQELLASVPDDLRIALKEKRKQRRAEVQVVQEGRSWRIVAIRPLANGA